MLKINDFSFFAVAERLVENISYNLEMNWTNIKHFQKVGKTLDFFL